MSNKLTYCCSNMEWMFKGRGRRGFALAVTEDKLLGTGLVCIDQEVEGSFHGPAGIPIWIVSHCVIKHCPWCGVNLKRYYTRFKSDLPITSITGFELLNEK